jgi:hypothetical protein
MGQSNWLVAKKKRKKKKEKEVELVRHPQLIINENLNK